MESKKKLNMYKQYYFAENPKQDKSKQELEQAYLMTEYEDVATEKAHGTINSTM